MALLAMTSALLPSPWLWRRFPRHTRGEKHFQHPVAPFRDGFACVVVCEEVEGQMLFA